MLFLRAVFSPIVVVCQNLTIFEYKWRIDATMSCSGMYALFVETGKEFDVKARLEYKIGEEYSFLVPVRRMRERKGGIWRYRDRKLLPGYILVKGFIDKQSYYGFKNIPGLYKLLRSGYDILDIPQHETAFLQTLTAEGELIRGSSVKILSGAVEVIDGPLKGLEGNIISVDHRKGRAKVFFDFLGQPRVVELAIEVLAQAAR